MSLPEFVPGAVFKLKPHEHAIRFVFGGVASLLASLVAHEYGPSIGGLLLAFPAILPASLTLVKTHDGRKNARDDARGARLGALGLVAYAVSVALLAPRVSMFLALAMAVVIWGAVSVVLWWMQFGASRQR